MNKHRLLKLIVVSIITVLVLSRGFTSLDSVFSVFFWFWKYLEWPQLWILKPQWQWCIRIREAEDSRCMDLQKFSDSEQETTLSQTRRKSRLCDFSTTKIHVISWCEGFWIFHLQQKWLLITKTIAKENVFFSPRTIMIDQAYNRYHYLFTWKSCLTKEATTCNCGGFLPGISSILVLRKQQESESSLTTLNLYLLTKVMPWAFWSFGSKPIANKKYVKRGYNINFLLACKPFVMIARLYSTSLSKLFSIFYICV